VECDYLIVGGGSAGCIVARRLADGQSGNVILLEAGKSDEGDPPMRDLARLGEQDKTTDWGFTGRPIAGGPANIEYLRARVLGGCANHNDCAWLIPPPSDFAEWAALGADGWNWADVEPYFAKVDDMVAVDTDPPASETSRIFIRACAERGIPERRLREGIDVGAGLFPLNVHGNLRTSSSAAYLHPLDILPGNLRVMTETTAHRLIVEDGRIVGCETDKGPIRAHREVILACGAVQTPQLMMVSGLGPADHLRENGIAVVADMPGVGRNLLDHCASSIVFDLKAPVDPWALTPCEPTMLMRIDDDAPAPDVLFHFILRVREKFVSGPQLGDIENGVKLSPNVARPKSRGRVSIVSSDFRDAPDIDLNYLSDPDGHDLRILTAAMRFGRRLMEAPSFAAIARREIAPGPDVLSDDELADYVRATAETVYHASGTCRMGSESDPLAATDSGGLVRGVGGLRICDASLFPAMVTVNINNTVMMVAEKIAAATLSNH